MDKKVVGADITLERVTLVEKVKLDGRHRLIVAHIKVKFTDNDVKSSWVELYDVTYSNPKYVMEQLGKLKKQLEGNKYIYKGPKKLRYDILRRMFINNSKIKEL